MNPKEILQNFFGYKEFLPGQEEIIQAILQKENVLAVLPTGGGKSLCFQIPALVSETFSIVVSPLIALMKDQVDALNAKGKISAFINSALDFSESEKVLNNLSSGITKILYVSPEKLANKNFIERIKNLSPSFLFVDEAHCISEWGHNFRPSYRKIKEFIDFIGIKNISAFTATATVDVRLDIIKQLDLRNPKVFIRGFERNNLHLNVFHTSHKKEKCVEILKDKKETAIIYAATRKMTEEIAGNLHANKIDAVYYHAGLTPELRRIIQDDFINGRVKTIVATNAFGMGIDKSNIRTIIHFNLPGSIENYYQEIGRAGRDGKESNIYLLYDDKDKLIQEYFILSGSPTRSQLEDVYDTICNCGNVSLGTIPSKDIALDHNFFSILDKKNLNRGLIDTSIKVLEESRYIKTKSDLEKKHYGQFLLEPNRLNAYFKNFADNELKDFILFLAREYGSKIFNSKMSINIHKLCDVFEISAGEAITQLKRLSSTGVFIYEEPLLTPSVSLLKNRIIAKDLSLNTKHINSVTEHSKTKLEKMIGYSFTDQCRFKFILDYFGEQNGNYKCGKCDNCTGIIQIGKDSLEYLEGIILQTIHESKTPMKIKTLVQILTGKADLSSLRKFSTFGSCVHFKKEEIINSLSNIVRSKLLMISQNVITLSEKGIEQFIIDENNSPTKSLNVEYENDLMLFNLLRQIRKEAAVKFNQSSDLICPDELLRIIAKEKPSTRFALISIKGFNNRMFNKIGEEFLNVIKNFNESIEVNRRLENRNLPDNIIQVLELIQKRYSLEDISSITKLPEAIVSIQIETLIEAIPELEINFLFDKNELKRIYQKMEDGITGLKELRDVLNNSISYGKIRIAAAKKKVS